MKFRIATNCAFWIWFLARIAEHPITILLGIIMVAVCLYFLSVFERSE